MFGVSMVVIAGAVAVVAALPLLAWSWMTGRTAPAPLPADVVAATGGPADRFMGWTMRSLGRMARRLTPTARVERLRRKVLLASSPSWNLERALAFYENLLKSS